MFALRRMIKYSKIKCNMCFVMESTNNYFARRDIGFIAHVLLGVFLWIALRFSVFARVGAQVFAQEF